MKEFIRNCKEEIGHFQMGAREWELYWFIVTLTVAAFTAIACIGMLMGN